MEFNNEYDLICPISLAKFTYPLVLDCGHSIDKPCFDKLINKKICPICNTPNTTETRINWSIVSFLKLNIPQPTKNSKLKNKRINSKEASQLLANQIKLSAENLIDNEIMEQIIQKIYINKKELIYTINHTDIKNEVIQILKFSLGYNVTYTFNDICITW